MNGFRAGAADPRHLQDGMADAPDTAPILDTLLGNCLERLALPAPILSSIGGKLQDLYQPDLAEATPDHLTILLQRLIAVLPDGAAEV